MSGTRNIKVGRDYFEKITGDAQVTTGASLKGEHAKLVQTITQQSPKKDILKLFHLILQQLGSSIPDRHLFRRSPQVAAWPCRQEFQSERAFDADKYLSLGLNLRA